jgi:hypothetical protein
MKGYRPMSKPRRKIIWVAAFICVLVGVILLLQEAHDQLLKYREVLAQVISLQKQDLEIALAMKELNEGVLVNLQEYNRLLDRVKDKKTAENALDQAIVLDREHDPTHKRFLDLSHKRVELGKDRVQAAQQLRATNTFMVRMLKTRDDRQTEWKNMEAAMNEAKRTVEEFSSDNPEVRRSTFQGVIRAEIQVNRERKRIRKLLDETWPKEWSLLTEIKGASAREDSN